MIIRAQRAKLLLPAGHFLPRLNLADSLNSNKALVVVKFHSSTRRIISLSGLPQTLGHHNYAGRVCPISSVVVVVALEVLVALLVVALSL